MMKVKLLAIILIILMITNLVALVTRTVSALFFWILTAIIAFIAFKIIPKFNHMR
jgi:hypothetical protein